MVNNGGRCRRDRDERRYDKREILVRFRSIADHHFNRLLLSHSPCPSIIYTGKKEISGPCTEEGEENSKLERSSTEAASSRRKRRKRRRLHFPVMEVVGKGSMHSNLDYFLINTTPVVPSQSLPKSEIRKLNKLWNPWERENVEYFSLNDLWNTYDEWSAYGAGVPVIDHSTGEQPVVQYYVPYLSALQIFTSTPSPPCFREDNESRYGETRDSFCSESCSDESESDKLSLRWDGCSSEEGCFEQESQYLQLNDRLGYLYCQYFERSTPYTRVPLVEKINAMAGRYPGLKSLRSVDLSPASWMAVSWYPIYHIPMGRTIKDLQTCFLTYHTLSSSFQDMDHEDDIEGGGKWKRKEGEGIPLPSFGLATYKMQGNLWVSGNDGRDQDRLASLLSVADSWLKQLRVQHHDFNYFNGIRGG